MNSSDDEKSRLERLLEAGVYAPVGFLVTRSKTMPDLAAAGRKQIAFARSLGQAALKGFVRSMNRDDDPHSGQAPATKQLKSLSPAPAAASSAVVDEPVEVVSDVVATAATETDDGAVNGYDDLTAKEIIELLKSGAKAQAQWVHDHELAHKERVTVLRAATKALG